MVGAWIVGPSRGPRCTARDLGHLRAAVNVVQAAGQSGGVTVIWSALKKLLSAALAAAQPRPPCCADPKVCSVTETAVYLGGDKARSAHGMEVC